MITFPAQRLSYKKKIEDDYAWAKKVVDYLLANRNTKDYKRKKRNYDIFNDVIDQKDFADVCDTLGVNIGQVEDKIEAYNKVANKINIILGEELKRPFNYTAYIADNEGIKQKEMQKTEVLKSWFMNKIKQIELQVRAKYEMSDQDKEEIDAMNKQVQSELDNLFKEKDVSKYMATGFLDAKEIMSNKLLNYLYKKLFIKDIKNDAFKHALLSGEECVWIGIEKGQVVCRTENSLNLFYHKSPDIKFIQDGLYAGTKRYMSAHEILDCYGNDLSEEDIKEISRYATGAYSKDKGITEGQTIHTAPHEMYYYSNGDNHDAQYETGGKQLQSWMVAHVEWRSQRKVGFLTIYSKEGETQEVIVGEEFIVPRNARKNKTADDIKGIRELFQWNDFDYHYELEWQWIPEVWEGTRIGHNIYARMRPKPYQYFSIDDPFKCELGYKGVAYSATNSVSISLMDRMIPVYYLYLIAVHKMKKLIAKDMGKVITIDLTQIDPELGIEKTLYYLKELNIDFYNPLHNAHMPGAAQRGKVTNVMDMSNMGNINNYLLLMDKLDMHLSDISGISRQREGQTGPTQAVTNAQQDLLQSSVVTEIYFHLHNLLWQKILTSLLSVARKYYADNKKTHIQYVLDDMSYETIKLDETLLEENEMNVFLIDSVKENEIFVTLKGLAQPLIQNDKARFSDIIKLLEANSIVDMKRSIIDFEKKQMEMMEQQQQFQAQEAQKAREEAFKEKVHLEQMKTDRELAKAQIDVFKFQQDLDIDNDGIPDPLEVEKFLAQKEMNNRKIMIEEKKLKLKEKEINIKKSDKK